MRYVAAVLLAVAFAQAPPQTDAGRWPPAGVYTRKDGATNPEILKRIEPVYAPEAIRARLQGFVTVQFVVEVDGTVGSVRVTKSLHRALDAAAVDAVKKWLFKPGRPESPTLAIMAVDPVSMAAVGVYRPAPLPGPIPFPMPLPQLARFSESMRAQIARSGPSAEIHSVGQSTLGSANWLWLELEGSTANLPVPSGTLAAMSDLIDGVRIWAFSTSVGSALIQVMCSQPHLKDATVQDRAAALAHAQASCAGILRRMSFTPRTLTFALAPSTSPAPGT